MATGTGKTHTAFNIIWRLWKNKTAKRVLFLADRTILVDQTIQNDFRPFGGVMKKLNRSLVDDRGRIDTSYEIYLGLYQAIMGAEDKEPIYDKFPSDFFDLIVIDECHRGSAAEDSAWREVLAYFDSAIQLGMTATHGALVRLVGDPRQAKAVGPGGALEIVARAGHAPGLTELRRFAHPWEADATLRLRQGDTGVIDVYDAHDRIRSGSYASMLEDTYRQYRDATAADPGAAVMIVSDNHTVQVLSERARADRVAAGRVEPGGVVLHDGSVAGIGDLIVTRRNDRQLRTGPSDAAYVKNRDRWEVTGRDPDGALAVRRVDSDQATTLPADYVADHVELSYALTGYGAQGLTVKNAFALVQPGDERSFACVAASRGSDANMIRVVTDTLDDETAGHQPERSAHDVLGDVLANEPAVTAGEALKTAAAGQYDAAELFDRHRHTTRTLAEHTLAGVLDARGKGELLGEPEAWRLIDGKHSVNP